MAGPVSMSLGSFPFSAIGFSYRTVGVSLDTKWAAIPVAGREDVLQWTGPTSKSFSIRGVLFPIADGGLSLLQGIQAAAEAGEPMMLVSRGGNIFGYHVVERITEDRDFIDRSGAPGQDAYEISVRRYGGAVKTSPGITLGGLLSLGL